MVSKYSSTLKIDWILKSLLKGVLEAHTKSARV